MTLRRSGPIDLSDGTPIAATHLSIQEAEEAEEQAQDNAERKRLARKLLKLDPPKSIDFSGLTINQTVEVTAKVFTEEVARLTLTGDFDRAEVTRRAAAVWRMCLPELSDRLSVMQFIACVAWGTRAGALDAQEAKTLMFMAQTQLSVLKVAGAAPRQAAPAVKQPADGELFPELPVPPQTHMDATAKQVHK